MPNYNLIYDEDQIKKFYDILIKPFIEKPNLTFIIIPITRRKYWEELTSSQINLSTKLVQTHNLTYDRFLNILKRYEVAEGLYTDPKSNKPIPGSAIAFYMTANPMDELKAMFQLMTEFNNDVHDRLYGSNEKHPSWKTESRFKSCLHQHPVKEDAVIKLDVDTKEEDKIQSLNRLLEEWNIPVVMKLATKNGYHYVLKREDQNQELHKFVRDKNNSDWVSIEKNPLILIPGTIQGGNPVGFAKDE